MTDLFTAEVDEVLDPDSSEDYADAIQMCDGRPGVRIKPCPYREQCREQGLRTEDYHTVRCGLRLWIKEEFDRFERGDI